MAAFSLILIVALMQPVANLRATGPHPSIALTSGSAPVYSPGELWGGGEPDEACATCTVTALLGKSGGDSLNDAQAINPVNGDFSTSNTLFSVNTTGGNLGVTLNYDSELAQAQAASGATYVGYYGWGWSSTINYGATNNAYGQVTLDEPNGSEVTFSPATSDSCYSGDYSDFQKYTVPNSYLPWCATSRLDAQLGSYGGVGYELTEGDGDMAGYSWTGQLAWSGTQADHTAITYTYNVSPGAANCASNGESSCYLVSDGTRTTSTQVNTFGLIQTVVDPSGQIWKIGYNDSTLNITSITTPNNSTTDYSYNSTLSSPYNEEMATETNPLGGVTTVYYTPLGMAGTLEDPTGGETNYTYSATTCASSGGCVGAGVTQNTEVSYQDGENDFDNYAGGVLQSDSWGHGTTSGSTSNQAWQFNFTYPATQFGTTSEAVGLPSGAGATIVTDPVGNVVSYTDPNGNTTQSMFNDTGGNDLDELCWTAAAGVNVPATASCSQPPPGSTSYTYNTNGQELSETDPLGNTSYMNYYSNGLLCWTAEASDGNGSPCTNAGTYPSGAPTGADVFEYAEGNQTLESDGFNTATFRNTEDEYDTDSELIASIPPDGEPFGTFGSNPYQTSYDYSSYGVLQSTSAPSPTVTAPPTFVTTSYTYNPAGEVLTETDPGGVTSNGYDTDGRTCWTLRASSPNSDACSTWPTGSTVYGYLLNTSYVTTKIDPNGNSTLYGRADYQHLSQTTSVTDAMGTQITFSAYDYYGDTCLTGPGNPWTSGTPTCPASASATPTGDASSLYNDEGQLLSTTDQTGETTKYGYTDAAYPGDPTSMTNPLSEVTHYTYDADGNEISATDPENNVITTAYDQDGRECYSAPVLTTAPCSSPPTGVGVSAMTWNVLDDRTQMVDNYGTSSAATSTFAYDYAGNLTSTTDDNGRTIGYTYGDAGEVTCVAYPVIASPNCANAPSSTNSVVDRAYNTAGQLTSTTDWLGNTVTYGGYNANSQVGQIVYPTTTKAETLSYLYDLDGNLTSAKYAGGTAGTNTWTYNADEEEATTSQLSTFKSTSDTYTNYAQVLKASNPTGTGSIADTYATAANGELTGDSPTGESAISLSYPTSDPELTSLSNPNLPAASSVSTYAYTADGQRCWSDASSAVISGATCGSAPAGATSYQWNARGQLCWSGQSTSTASCTSPPTGVTSYTYDGDGLRMTETPASGSELTFSWDMVDDGSTPLLLDDGTNAYVYGEPLFGGTAPVEQINLSTDAVSFLAAIPSGVQDVFAKAGTVQEQAAYSTYGTQSIEAGTDTTPFGFQGSYTDSTGLIYLVNRYYDPSTYQFISVDPNVAETMQPYAFTNGDPLNATDPLGMMIQSEGSGYCGTTCHSPQPSTSSSGGGGGGWFSSALHFVAHVADVGGHFVAAHKQDFLAAAVVIGTSPLDEIGVGEGIDAEVIGDELASDAADEAADDLASCPGESFSPDTMVRLAKGALVPISTLKVGDRVLATNPVTGKSEAETVTATDRHDDHDLMDVVVKTSAGAFTIRATDKHLFWDATTSSWTMAEALRSGDVLRTDNGALATVAATIQLSGNRNMWDLTVAVDHDFYVSVGAGSQTAVLVHNCGDESIQGSSEDYDHVMQRHTLGGQSEFPQYGGRSYFSDPTDIEDLVQGANDAPQTASGSNFYRTVDAGREIGWDRASGEMTSMYTVWTNADNVLQTAYPGVP